MNVKLGNKIQEQKKFVEKKEIKLLLSYWRVKDSPKLFFYSNRRRLSSSNAIIRLLYDQATNFNKKSIRVTYGLIIIIDCSCVPGLIYEAVLLVLSLILLFHFCSTHAVDACLCSFFYRQTTNFIGLS